MNNKNLKIVVTGGAGFIGSNLVDKISINNNVTVIDDFSIGSKKNLEQASSYGNLKIIKADVRNLQAMRDILKGADMVFHFAVKGVRESLNNPSIVHEINTTGTLNLCIAAYENKIKKFIYISSSEVYGTAQYVPMNEKHPLVPTTVYGVSKYAGEMYAEVYFRTYGLPIIIIRPFNTYGPRSHFEGGYGEVIPRFIIRAINNLPPTIFGDGTQTRDFTYVEDTVKGVLKAAGNDKLIGQVVNIAYGTERSINDVSRIILECLNKKRLGVIYKEARPGDVMRHHADTTKAKKAIGFKSRIPLEEGIKRYISWLKKQKIDFKKALKSIQDKNW